jgi:hypothetical protein
MISAGSERQTRSEDRRMPRSALDRRQLLVRTAALAGGAALAAADLTGSAAAATKPRIYTRAAWKARAPVAAASIIAKPDHLVVHHTASANSTDYSRSHAFALSRSIQRLHMDTNGWDDTGQQLTISRGGYIMEGRNRSLQAIGQKKNVLGAQTLSHNSHTLGIENEGTYISANPTRKLWDSLVETLAWLCDVYDLDPHRAIVGHRDYNQTQCPGDALYARLPKLRNDVAVSLGLAGLERSAPLVRSGLPGPRAPFDHGPALAPDERHR